MIKYLYFIQAGLWNGLTAAKFSLAFWLVAQVLRVTWVERRTSVGATRVANFYITGYPLVIIKNLFVASLTFESRLRERKLYFVILQNLTVLLIKVRKS